MWVCAGLRTVGERRQRCHRADVRSRLPRRAARGDAPSPPLRATWSKAPVFEWKAPRVDWKAPVFDWEEVPVLDRRALVCDSNEPVFIWRFPSRRGAWCLKARGPVRLTAGSDGFAGAARGFQPAKAALQTAQGRAMPPSRPGRAMGRCPRGGVASFEPSRLACRGIWTGELEEEGAGEDEADQGEADCAGEGDLARGEGGVRPRSIVS